MAVGKTIYLKTKEQGNWVVSCVFFTIISSFLFDCFRYHYQLKMLSFTAALSRLLFSEKTDGLNNILIFEKS